METKIEKKKRTNKKSSKVKSNIVTGFEGQGKITLSMSTLGVSKEKWEKIFGKKNTKAKSNKKT